MSSRIQIMITDEAFQVPCLWDVVRQVRIRVDEKLSAYPTDFRESAALVAGELAENLTKYSINSAGIQAKLGLDILDDAVTIRSINGANATEAAWVLRVLETTSNHEDPVELYAEMIEESLSRMNKSTQQGFYRIAAVGGFTLQGDYKENVLTITARREI